VRERESERKKYHLKRGNIINKGNIIKKEEILLIRERGSPTTITK